MGLRQLTILALLALTATAAPADPGTSDPRTQLTRVLADGVPNDRRLGPPRRVTDGNHFTPYAERAAWALRVRRLREQALVAAGLWPMPDKCPLKATVTGVID